MEEAEYWRNTLGDFTTWRKEILSAMPEYGECFDDIISITLSEEELDKEFYAGYGGSEGKPFTAWTRKMVYFPVVYDGAEWVGAVPRHPNGVATKHQGGE